GDLTQRRGYLIPTVQGNFDRMQGQIGNIVNKLDKVPLEAIGQNLDDSLASLNRVLRGLDTELMPQTSHTLSSVNKSLDRISDMLAPDSPVFGSLRDTLSELDRAARALRLLSDTLQTRPDALLRGRAPDALH